MLGRGSNEHRSRRPTTAIVTGASVLAVDQATKLATGSARCGPVVCPVRNDVLFLSFGAGSVLTTIAIGFVGLALFVAWRRVVCRRGAVVSPVAGALVVSGIIANIVDRVLFGAVRDFIVVPGVAIGNVADIAIAAGLVWCQFALVIASRHRTPLVDEGR